MENGFLVYATIAAVVLGFLVLRAARNDQTYARKFAKVRIPIDERSRRRVEEPLDEDYDTNLPPAWLLIAAVILGVLLLIQAM